MKILKALLNILKQAASEPNNLIANANEFFYLYHSSSTEVISEK
jgi:hypothetical protein